MNFLTFVGWLILAIGATMFIVRFGELPLIAAIRALDRVRAAIRCSGLVWDAAVEEWYRQWESCLRWAQRER